jgi:hypothetical protein
MECDTHEQLSRNIYELSKNVEIIVNDIKWLIEDRERQLLRYENSKTRTLQFFIFKMTAYGAIIAFLIKMQNQIRNIILLWLSKGI